jgi:hypothetical protein
MIARLVVITVGLSSFFCTTFTSPAEAQPQAGTESRTGQIAVEGQIGYDTPLGVSGLAIDVDLRSWISISAGVGTDMFVPEKYYTCPCPDGRKHAALMPRLRLPVFDGATFLALGVGLSRSSKPEDDVPNVLRQDDELALEHRFENGVRARAFAGFGFSLRGSPSVFGTLYAGAALGYAVAPNPDHSSATGPWYGWQAALSDTIAAVLGAYNRQYPHAFPTAIALYAVPGPIIHVAHHHGRRAVASAALRGLLPFVSQLALTSVDDNGGNDRRAVMVAGAVVAALVDDLALSWGN